MSQTAIASPSKGGGFTSITIPIPEASSLGSSDVLVKVHASGVNPLDIGQAFMGAYIAEFPYVLGKAWAGEVVAFGDKVEKLSVGDKVLGAGYVVGAAAFQEYLVTPVKYATKFPDSLSYTDAATIPHTFAGSFVNLFSEALGLGLPLPPKTDEEKNQGILVWGGSSSTGISALQALGALGFQSLFTVAGEASLDSLNKLPGVKGAYDRKLSADELAEKIKKDAESSGGIRVVYSTMSDAAGWDAVFKILNGVEGKIGYIHLVPPPESLVAATEGKVKVVRSVVMDMLTDPIGETLVSVHLSSLLESGAVKPAKTAKVISEGSLLEKVQAAVGAIKGGARDSLVVQISA
ncbi:chaperonin 10-like protein [Flagelloscypha sp. PMI_526]|nr:chaperonin 10-like protein [Flagelloscypha sp. PMI_526]